MIRRRFVLRGIVQGVGFRPHVARVAAQHPVTGFCGNDDESVFLELQGSDAAVADALAQILAELPPLAEVRAQQSFDLELLEGESTFVIVESQRTGGGLTLIPPDIARCDDCLRELRDPNDRRWGYPFISCTNCGPRFSIIQDLPYDRANTTLSVFPMCAACAAEYTDPLNRRYHAEPISCYDCGPTLWLDEGEGEPQQWAEAINRARALLAEGAIVAVKGMGGFTLMCDARNEAAVATLRQRKHRPGKPLAVMAADRKTAASFANFSREQLAALTSPQRPIVLAPHAATYDLAPSVAPGLGEVGVMLPSAPVHDLLLEPGMVLVATSGNTAGEPLCYRNEDALRDLAPIADAFLLNNRDIHVPVEDSVLMADGEGLMPIRRSRGFAPLPVPLDGCRETLLAVGGELKNTFSITRDGLAFVSAHIGDMGALATQRAFERSVDQMLQAHRRSPELLVADLHPSYSTTAWASRYAEAHELPLLQVQHHRAHALSLLAEHQLLDADALCIVFDGTGYGDDGTIWGGELLRMRAGDAERVWHLPLFDLPGGDSAVAHPWKSAIALLDALGIDDADLPPLSHAPEAELALVRSQLANRVAVVPTSSAGRLFDAVASLLDICHDVSYEAQAAMELETVARDCRHQPHIHSHYADLTELVQSLADGVRADVSAACLARIFHSALADLVAEQADRLANPSEPIGLTGGVFQNRMLSRDIEHGLRARTASRSVIRHTQVPANDGGLSLGQAAAGFLARRQEGVAACVSQSPEKS